MNFVTVLVLLFVALLIAGVFYHHTYPDKADAAVAKFVAWVKGLFNKTPPARTGTNFCS